MSVSYSVTEWGGIEQLFATARSWSSYNNFVFWFYGNGSGNRFRVELYDNGASAGSAERFEYQFADDDAGWRHFIIPLNAFTRRGDWQPGGVPNDGLTLTQIWGVNLSPLSGNNSFKADQMQLTY